MQDRSLTGCAQILHENCTRKGEEFTDDTKQQGNASLNFFYDAFLQLILPHSPFPRQLFEYGKLLLQSVAMHCTHRLVNLRLSHVEHFQQMRIVLLKG